MQKSVFEADVKADEFVRLLDVLAKIALKGDESIRLYRICAECTKMVRVWGKGEVTYDQDFYIV